MTVFSLGSITAIDEFEMPRLTQRSETLTAIQRNISLGGQGVAHSVALTRAGADVRHIGAIGKDGSWLKRSLQDLGVKTGHVTAMNEPSGIRIVQTCAGNIELTIDAPGANLQMTDQHITRGLRGMSEDDWLLLGSETNGQAKAIEIARKKGAKIAYCAMPFDIGSIASVARDLDLLILKDADVRELCWASDIESLHEFVVPQYLILNPQLGGKVVTKSSRQTLKTNNFAFDPVDTSASKEVFVGYFLAALAEGAAIIQALARGNIASMHNATRPGGVAAIPTADEIAAATNLPSKRGS